VPTKQKRAKQFNRDRARKTNKHRQSAQNKYGARTEQINARRGVNHLLAETISNQRRGIRGKLAPRKVRETPLNINS